MRVLYITSEWPTEEHYWAAPFIVRQVEFLRKAGLDIDVFPYRGRKNISNYIRIHKNLHRQIQSTEYDLVHAQFGISGLLACLPKRTPLVVTFRGSDLQGIYTSMGIYHPISYPVRAVLQIVAFCADEVVLVSKHMSRYLLRKEYHVIPGGLDLKLFKPMPQMKARQQLELPLNGKIVLFVGSEKNSVKRYHLAKSVMSHLNSDLNSKLLVVTGVDPQKMPVYLNAADTLLVTSKHEGSPNVVKEAMACNLPIVTVDVGDVKERLANVTGCAIISSDNPNTIAHDLARILHHGQRTNGWEIAQELDEAQLVQQQIKVYESAIRRYRKRRHHE